MSKEYESTGGWEAETSPYNALEYAVKTIINKKINTALPVTVTSVESKGHSNATGYLTVKPLIKQRDAEGNAIEQTEIYHLPYSRIQGGKCAIVCDPEPGDIGLAIFAQKDCSNLKQGKNEEVTVGSYRNYSMSDGFYIGGFLNKAPSIYIELLQDGHIVLHPGTGATDSVLIEGNTTIKGNLIVNGTITTDGSSGGSGDVTISGKVTATGDVKGGGISLDHHTHPCPHGGNTGEPN